jgi:hypothetical protein
MALVGVVQHGLEVVTVFELRRAHERRESVKQVFGRNFRRARFGVGGVRF